MRKAGRTISHVQPYAKGIRNKWYELEPFLLFFLVEGGDRTLQHHEDQDHQADHDGGPFGRHAEVGGQRVDGGTDQSADDGTEHVAEAAGDDGAADDHGGHSIKFPADATVLMEERMLAVYTMEGDGGSVAEAGR